MKPYPCTQAMEEENKGPGILYTHASNIYLHAIEDTLLPSLLYSLGTRRLVQSLHQV